MTTVRGADRFFTLAGGVAGACGVVLAAAAAHMGGGNISTAANFLLLHAPVLLIVGLAGRSGTMRLGAAAITLGLILFCGDLILRHYTGTRMFPLAAPAGGILLIGGWLVVAIGGLVRERG